MSATEGDTRGFFDEERGFEVLDEECEDFFLLSVSDTAMPSSSLYMASRENLIE
jgi:hypothetical protein